MNLLESIKIINDLIPQNAARFQFLMRTLKSSSKFGNSILTTDEIVFTPKLFHEIEQIVALNFESETNVEGNVCFSNHIDLRSEFKDSFSAEDVLNCLYAVLNLEIENSTINCNSILKIIEKNNKPEIQLTFWKLVEIGTNMRNITL